MSELDLTKKDKSRLRGGLNILDWDEIKKHPQFSVVVDEIKFLITDMAMINSAIFKTIKDSNENTFGLSDEDNAKIMYLNFSQFAYNEELNTIIKYLLGSVNDEGQLILDPPQRKELAQKFGIKNEVREFAERLIGNVGVINKVK